MTDVLVGTSETGTGMAEIKNSQNLKSVVASITVDQVIRKQKKAFPFVALRETNRNILLAAWLYGRVKPVVGKDLMTVASPADDMHRNTP